MPCRQFVVDITVAGRVEAIGTAFEWSYTIMLPFSRQQENIYIQFECRGSLAVC